MDSRIPYAALALLLLLSLHSTITVKAASVIFLDSPTRHYFRFPFDQDALTESDTMSLPEVGAALSVLLGSAPPSTLSQASSLKLNKVLTPNPFDRPQAVFALEVTGTEDFQLEVSSFNGHFTSALKSKLTEGEIKADIELPEEDEVSVISLNDLDSDSGCSAKDLSDFASLFGGSYSADNLPLSGELSVPLASGAHLRLELSKKADREYITSLVSLFRNIQRVIEMHQVLAEGGQNYGELITGKFDGIKALQEHYGREGVAGLGLELFVASIGKILDSLQAAYKGEIVGAIVHSGKAPLKSTKLLNALVTTRQSPRWLEETELSPNSTAVAEAVLVRRIVAWTTGLVLIIATLLGIYFLVNMPLTRDTLLYSNVKLD